MDITANGVLAVATSVYGFATTGLLISSFLDRRQRDKHFQHEQSDRKLESLYQAFYEAWGYWHGLWQKSGQSPVTATEAAKTTEALIRLQAQLRINGHTRMADVFQRAILTRDGIEEKLSTIGRALGLLHQP